LLTAFPLSEIERVVRRTALMAIAFGVVAGVIAVILGQPLFAPGMAVGLILAIVNHRVFQSSAMRFTSSEGVVNRKPFAGSVAVRLGVCTLVAVGLLILDEPVGWGVIGGLALFQATMLFMSIIALIKYQRQGIAEGGTPNA
jgi:uncharacterized membrane protein